MANLKTDSPLSHRIVLSFLHFLNSVEPAPGVDLEGLDVAKECLAEVFKIDSTSVDIQSNTDSLIDIFNSLDASRDRESNQSLAQERLPPHAPVTSSSPSNANTNGAEVSRSEGEDRTRDPHKPGVSKDELFGQFFGALESIHYFKSMADGNDDPVQLDRASQAFHSALEDMQRSGCETFELKNLAEALKSKGNMAMQSKHYSNAIELYTFAIALYQDNAVYYCNRAAAFTQIHQYTEAIQDSLKAIRIDPNYSKAYSRLGFVYYAQGKYRDAIDKGFMKALQLDPDNESVKENIRVAEQKLREQHQRTGHNQSSSSGNHRGDTNHQFAGGTRTSIPIDVNNLSPDIASFIENLTANIQQVPLPQDGPQVDIDGARTGMPFDANNFPPDIAGINPQFGPQVDIDFGAPNDPSTRVGGNINVNVGHQVPQDINVAIRSVMEMLSGATTPGNAENDTNRRPSPS